jgi:hypothetical protein
MGMVGYFFARKADMRSYQRLLLIEILPLSRSASSTTSLFSAAGSPVGRAHRLSAEFAVLVVTGLTSAGQTEASEAGSPSAAGALGTVFRHP